MCFSPSFWVDVCGSSRGIFVEVVDSELGDPDLIADVTYMSHCFHHEGSGKVLAYIDERLGHWSESA